MPNPIKYTTGSESDALVKGNFRIGTGAVGKGPSDVTGYYQGPDVPSGGYVIYLNREGAPGGLSYHSAANDAQLIAFTNNLTGQSYTTVQQCFDYYYGQNDKVLVNQDYPPDYPYIIMDGLVLYLDAGITQSYPGSGTTWTDVNGLGPRNNGTLTNGPTFNSANGGSIVFDGTNDFVTINQTLSTPITICGFVKYNNQSQPYNTWINSFPHNVLDISLNRIGGGQIYVYIGNGSGWQGVPGIISSTNMSVNTWYYVAYVSNGSGSILYLNGANVGSSVYSPSGWGSRYYLGSVELSFSPEYLNGNIGNTQIYNRALTQSEITQNYNATKSRFGL
jgi:hypothetical protein